MMLAGTGDDKGLQLSTCSWSAEVVLLMMNSER